MSSSRSAIHLQEILRMLPTMRLNDLNQLLHAVEQRRHTVETSFVIHSTSTLEAVSCFLARLPDALCALSIGSFLTDADACSWAQCSKRSLHQLQKRPFLKRASFEVTMELSNSLLRHRAAFGFVRRVVLSTWKEWKQVAMLPLSVRSIKFGNVNTLPMDTPSPSSSSSPSYIIPECVTEVTISHRLDQETVQTWLMNNVQIPSHLLSLRLSDRWYSPLPFKLPDSLTYLNIGDSPYLDHERALNKVYPQKWPSQLRTLRCSPGIPLSELSPFPPSLTELDTDGIPPQHCSNLPASITRLDWGYAIEVASIPLDSITFPLSLKEFNYSMSEDQSLLQLLSILPPRLQELRLYISESHIASFEDANAISAMAGIKLTASPLKLPSLCQFHLHIPNVIVLRHRAEQCLQPVLPPSCTLHILSR